MERIYAQGLVFIFSVKINKENLFPLSFVYLVHWHARSFFYRPRHPRVISPQTPVAEASDEGDN
jgi:hypothetical protein